MAGANDQILEASIVLKDEFSAGMKQAQDALAAFDAKLKGVGQSGAKALSGLQTAAGKLGSNFESVGAALGQFDASTSKLLAKTANLTNRLLGVALAANTLGARDGGFKAAGDGLATFAGIAAALPGPVGLALGAVAGIAMAFKSLKDEEREAAEHMRHLQRQIEETRRAMYEARGAFSAGIMTSSNPALALTQNGIQNTKDAIGHQLALLEQARVAMDKNAARPLSEAFLRAKDSAEEAETNIAKLKKTLGELQDEAARLVLDEKMREMATESDVLHEKVMLNIVTPLDAAKERLRMTEQAMADLIKIQQKLAPEEFRKRMDGLLAEAGRNKSIIDAGQLDADLKRARDVISDFERDSGIALSEETKARLAAMGKESQRQLHDALEQIRKEVEANPLGGLELALADLTKESFSFRKAWNGIFGDMQRGFSDAFAGAILGTKKLSDSLKSMLNSLKQNMVKMLTDFVTSNLFKALGGGILGMFGIGGGMANGQATVDPRTGMPVNAGAVGGGFGGMSFGAAGGGAQAGLFGLQGTSAALAGLGLGAAGLGGAYLMQRGVQRANMGMSIAGGALTGAAMGTAIMPGIGTAVGAIAGAALGWAQGSRAKDQQAKAEARQRKLREEAEERHQLMLEEGRKLILSTVRSQFGGGLVTPDGAREISELFSGGISDSEIEGLAQKGRLNQPIGPGNGSAQYDVGGIHIALTAYVGGRYDISKISQELAEDIQSKLTSALSQGDGI